MIRHLTIENFKSIRRLELECRRVNVFIGEPNTGKTNALEALALWDIETRKVIAKALRITNMAQLHWNNDPSAPVRATAEFNKDYSERYCLEFRNSHWAFLDREEDLPDFEELAGNFVIHNGNIVFDAYASPGPEHFELADITSYYLFRPLSAGTHRDFGRLASPFGQNVATLLLTSKEARQTAARFFEGTGYRLKVDSGTQSISIAREVDDTLISFPYEGASETLRRMIFYSLALDTNRDRVLLFDEPEAHSFPPYTKLLAERFALDDRGNQFFLTTHSPYMLDSLLSKTPASDLSVVLFRQEDFETKVHPLDQDQIDQIKEWSMDAFFNFDRLIPQAE